MPKVSRRFLDLPDNISYVLSDNLIEFTGPFGSNSVSISPLVRVDISLDKRITIKQLAEDDVSYAISGTMFALVKNAVIGVSKGYEAKLEIVGVGYKAALENNQLVLNLGYSHPIILDIPPGMSAKLPTQLEILITGVDKAKLGQFVSVITSKRKDKYKGKGIRLAGTVFKLKAVKKK